MKKTLILILFLLFLGSNREKICFAQVATPGTVERSQEILEKEKALRERIEREERVFIKKITVTGVTLINKDRIKQIILPYKNHWLSKADIQAILDAISQAYQEKGYAGQPAKISYEIKKNYLKIKVEE